MRTPVSEKTLEKVLSRRTFLRTLSATISGALLVGCGPARGDDEAAVRIAFGPQVTPQTILPSPMPDATPTQVADTDTLAVEEFLLLSAGLTGVTNLDPELGHLYLQSLNRTHGATALVELFNTAGLSVEESNPDTELSGMDTIQGDAAQQELAATIAKLWYTGIYTNAAGEDQVATYVDSLAWRSLAFTKPKTICGEPGFWSEAPEAVLD